jgi:hypothetical protein
MPMRLEATKLSLKVRRAAEVHLVNHEALTSQKAGAISIRCYTILLPSTLVFRWEMACL